MISLLYGLAAYGAFLLIIIAQFGDICKETSKASLPIKGRTKRLPLLIKGSCPSAHTGAEGIRTSIFPGIVNNRAFTIPQSQPSVRRLCQLPLHKGALGAPTPVRFLMACNDIFFNDNL